MTTYYNYSVNLSIGQKKALAKAYSNNEAIKIRLANTQLQGSDEMMLTKTQINRIRRAIVNNKGTDLSISKAQIRKSIKQGGSLFSTILSLGSKLLPMATKMAGNVVPGLATGALSSLGNFGVDKILGQGQVIGDFRIPRNKINQLLKYRQFLTDSQIDQILRSKQNGGQVIVQPTNQQMGGFLGAVLATIGLPLSLKALGGGQPGKGLRVGRPPRQPGKGLQVDKHPVRSAQVYVPPQNKGGRMYPFDGPPPFFGSWDRPRGLGMRTKKRQKKEKGKDYY